MKQKKKPYLAVNQAGFISIYALIFLQLSLAFVTMICIRCDTLIMKNKKQDLIEVYLINHVKETYEEGELESEDITWKEYEIHIEYEELIADITCEDINETMIHMQMEYDDICMCVMKIAYLDEP